MDINQRHAFATEAVAEAATLALELFRQLDNLVVESKGLQDWVSNADKSVEDLLRAAILERFPGDGIVGEERANTQSASGYTWVIDPIDGTSNFVTGTPGWCVVLACVKDKHTVLAVICDPIAVETYTAIKHQGALLNGKPIQVHAATALNQGTLGVGHSPRVPAEYTVNIIDRLLSEKGLFRRSGSGALDLAYVAAGRLVGFVEPHMNAWDCLAALLLIEEAGGVIVPFDPDRMLASGGQVIAACPGVFERVKTLANEAYQPTS